MAVPFHRDQTLTQHLQSLCLGLCASSSALHLWNLMQLYTQALSVLGEHLGLRVGIPLTG